MQQCSGLAISARRSVTLMYGLSFFTDFSANPAPPTTSLTTTSRTAALPWLDAAKVDVHRLSGYLRLDHAFNL